MQQRRAHFRCLSCIYVKGKKGSREVDAHVTSGRRRVFKGLWSQTGHRQSGLCASCHLLKVKAFSLLLKVAKIILGYWDLKEKLVDMTTPHLNLKNPSKHPKMALLLLCASTEGDKVLCKCSTFRSVLHRFCERSVSTRHLVLPEKNQEGHGSLYKNPQKSNK